MPRGKRTPIKKLRARPPTVELDDKESKDFLEQDFSKISTGVRMRRDLFAQEYMKDFNASAALRRMGYKWKTVQPRASEWLREPYTQWKISQLTAKLDEKTIVTRLEVLSGLKREAFSDDVPFSANASTRISALRALAKILGMEVTKIEGTMTLNGGVMAVPFAGSLEEWEKKSKESQSELKKAVRK